MIEDRNKKGTFMMQPPTIIARVRGPSELLIKSLRKSAEHSQVARMVLDKMKELSCAKPRN
jgi:hypothetical protein